jgi:hypothetical protein
MLQRPSSVLAVGVVLCGLGVLSMLMSMAEMPGTDVTPVWMSADQLKYYHVSIWIGIVGAVGTLFSGIYILSGDNWARWFYAALCLALLSYDVFFQAGDLVRLVPALVIRAVCIVVLFLPNANEYFTRRPDRWH